MFELSKGKLTSEPDRHNGGSLEDADGGAFTSLCIAIEELGRVDQSIGITLSAGVGLGINPILTYGTDAQKERFLPDLVAGRALAGFGLTEPDAGSDAGATRTKAVLEDGPAPGSAREWVVDGSKAFITNSGTDITSVVTVTSTGAAAGAAATALGSIIGCSMWRALASCSAAAVIVIGVLGASGSGAG